VRTPKPIRLAVAAFNLAAALGLALYLGQLDQLRRPELAGAVPLVWGAALAAFVALVAVAFESAILGWIAIGYLLWAGLLAGAAPALLLLALALALMPVVPRPSGSIAQGLVMAGITALVIALLGVVARRL
jgi:hypothetical protein